MKVKKNYNKFVVYWHKCANSGLWEFNTKENAVEVARQLAEQKDVYDVVVIDIINEQKLVIKQGSKMSVEKDRYMSPQPINNEVTQKLSIITDCFDIAYNDGEDTTPKEFEDDDFIHVSRGKVRYIFYNGQDKGKLTKKDVKKFAGLVDKTIKEVNGL